MIVFLLILIYFHEVWSQTTFTKSAVSYGLDIAGTKDGTHACGDYDLDGDFDVFINTNTRGYLWRFK